MSINFNKEKKSLKKYEKDNEEKIIIFPNTISKKKNIKDFKETNIVIKEKKIAPYSIQSNKVKSKNILQDFMQKNKFTTNGNIPPKNIIIAIVSLILAIILLWSIFHKNAQEIYIGDYKIGTIAEKNMELEEFKTMATEELKARNTANVQINDEIILKPIKAGKDEIVDIEEAINVFCDKVNFNIEASSITVNGKAIASVKNKEEAELILNNIKAKYITQERKQLQEATFVEDVKIENKFMSKEDIIKEEEALALLTANANQDKKYEIKAGDTLFELSLKNDMPLDEILAANPDITEDTPLKIGREINLVVPVPLLSIRTYEEVTINETIARPIETVENNKEYKTYRKVLQQGKDGNKQVVAKITKVNGVEEKRDVISEKIIAEPQVEKVEVGTLNTPPKKAIGSFLYPVNGRLSSGYGARWGTTHTALDLACPSGTPIKASDGGTVVFSGWNSSGYGNMVKIDHGNGFQTVYAHNSKNAVQTGQKVAQGEIIGYVGSTGNSTGNHVHFEIIKNGATQNPINYLK